MNLDAVITALNLPASANLRQRVPKKLLVEHGAATAADRRYINQGVENVYWVAALKPTTIGVPAYRDETREYLEISILRLTLRPEAKVARLVDLAHRAIPYPVLLLAEPEEGGEVSCAHKRWSEAEADETVLDGPVVATVGEADDHTCAFLSSIAVEKLPRTNMLALYQGWIDAILALHAAAITGEFSMPENAARARERASGLEEYAEAEDEIARLRNVATRERQIARRVEMNLKIKQLEAAREAAGNKL